MSLRASRVLRLLCWRLSEYKVGLLINFNVKWLADHGIKRMVNGFPD